MKSMKMIVGIAAATLMLAGGAALAKKESPPPPEKMKKLSFPSFKEFKLDNGLDVVVVEQHEQPVASIWLAVRAGHVLAPTDRPSLADFASDLLNKGTKDKNSDQLAEWIESYGGQYNASTTDDYAQLSLTILSDYLDVAYQYLSDIVLNPTFPDSEFATERKRTKTALQFQLSDPNSMADRHFNEVVYGNHPYAAAPTVEGVDAVTRDDIVAFHDKYYVADNTLLFVVGDVHAKQVKKDVEKYFGKWAEGQKAAVSYPAPPQRTKETISLYHRPGAVQTNIYVGELGLHPSNPDWPAVTVGNQILGGGASGRLFVNLREDKGYTYGAYSRFSKPVDIGYFRATANCRTAVTDSALTEMIAEIKRMVDEPVSQEDLDHAKSYLIGNFPTTIETPRQIARQIGQVKLLGLDKSYLENYRKRIAKVTIADVQNAMKKYVHPDQLAIILVGDATKIEDKVKGIAPVSLYDIEGKPMSLQALSVQATDFDYDTSPLKDMQAVYSVKVPQMDLGDMSVSLKRASDEAFELTTTLSGMLAMNEKVEFGTKAFEPVSYDFTMNAMGQQMKASYTFADGTAKGTIEGGPKGNKDVSVDLVKGTIMDSALEYVIATLPLEQTKAYTFPVLDGQSGSLENVKIAVVGEEDVTVPAGSFSTYKVEVKRGSGQQLYYVTKDTPHLCVKQEVPSQQLDIELKSVQR